MAGTVAGGLKMGQTILKRYFNGDPEALHRWRQEIGAAGGRKSRGGGFTVGSELAKEAGAKGGAASRRGFSRTLKTHCLRGHEYTPENTMTRPDRPRERRCRACYNTYYLRKHK